MSKKNFAAVAIGVTLVGAFAVIKLAANNWDGLTLNREIKPIDVATLAFTIIIAIILQFYFASAADNDRAEKDLLIANANDALSKLRECRDTFVKCYENQVITESDQIGIKTQIRSLNHALDALEISLGKSGCHKLKCHCAELMRKSLEYKAVLTGGSFPTTPYSSEAYSYQQRVYRELDVKLQELIFSINRA